MCACDECDVHHITKNSSSSNVLCNNQLYVLFVCKSKDSTIYFICRLKCPCVRACAMGAMDRAFGYLNCDTQKINRYKIKPIDFRTDSSFIHHPYTRIGMTFIDLIHPYTRPSFRFSRFVCLCCSDQREE